MGKRKITKKEGKLVGTLLLSVLIFSLLSPMLTGMLNKINLTVRILLGFGLIAFLLWWLNLE